MPKPLKMQMGISIAMGGDEGEDDALPRGGRFRLSSARLIAIERSRDKMTL